MPKTRFELHPKYVYPAYQSIHKWLASSAPNYRSTSDEVTGSGTLEKAGAHFDSYNHLHAFKAQAVIEELIANQQIPNLFILGVKHVIVDIACGSGAASVGFINALVQHNVFERLPKPLHLYFVGLDPDHHALEIYTKYLRELKRLLDPIQINMDFHCVPQEVPIGIDEAANRINEFREKHLQRNNISSFFLFQMNAVRPFQDRDEAENAIRHDLESRGIPIGDESSTPFNRSVFDAYRRLCESSVIDQGLMITIGTKELQWREAVQNCGNQIQTIFSEHAHQIEDWTGGSPQRSILWLHPAESRRHARYGHPQDPNPYFVDIRYFRTSHLVQDYDWDEITSLENLKLAWIRARRYQMRESLVDELEIKIFEQELETNLSNLQERLHSYLKDIGNTSSRLPYAFPKKWNDTQSDIEPRPRVLTRFEEDIIAVAVVQVIGRRIDIPNSFEYRLENTERPSEFLYEHYLKGYQDWIEQIRGEAQRLRNRNGVILQTDIQSFYTHIQHELLIGSVL